MQPLTQTHQPMADTLVDAPTTEIQTSLMAVVGDQCVSCGSALAADQRYCLECGQRRGQARLPLMEALAPTTNELQVAAPRPPHIRRRLSPDSSLIAGIGTLVLAMGVGVLIGRTGNGSSPRSAPAVQVVSIPGTGAAATTASPVTAAGKNSAASKGASATHIVPSKPPPVGAKLPPVAAPRVGSPGKGRGYQHGKFTGNFFGAGQ